MRLLIISITDHFRDGQTIRGWGATVREIDQLAQLCTEVVHLAPLYDGPCPESALAYTAPNVRVQALKAAGGSRPIDKLKVLLAIPKYVFAILREFAQADMVHVRCPANLPLIAIVLLAFLPYPRKRWIKYGGNWNHYETEARSYAFQRWWLKRNFARAIVTVNGTWENLGAHIRSFYNPCLTDSEVEEGRQIAEQKSLNDSMQLVFVGRLEEAKGVSRVFEIIKRLKDAQIPLKLDLIGDSPERAQYENRCRELGLEEIISFHGWRSREDLNAFYAKAHIALLPSSGEGWPKVLSEAMAYGVVPVCSNVGSIPQYLERFGTGHALEIADVDAYANAIRCYYEKKATWKLESQNAVAAASHFSYSYYLDEVRKILIEATP